MTTVLLMKQQLGGKRYLDKGERHFKHFFAHNVGTNEKGFFEPFGIDLQQRRGERNRCEDAGRIQVRKWSAAHNRLRCE